MFSVNSYIEKKKDEIDSDSVLTNFQPNDLIIKDEIDRFMDKVSKDKVIKKKESRNRAISEADYHLGEKLSGDVLSSIVTSICVSPFITIVDKAIVQRAAGSHTISKSILASVSNILRNPIVYFRSPMFLMMWGVYASTYTTANVFKTLIEHEEIISKKKNTEKSSVNNDYMKFGSFGMTTLVNSGASLMKDRAYATMFGTSSGSLPLVTYGLWGLRDCVVISSSFIFPEIMGKALHEKANMDKKEALSISQIICPVAAQVIATPLQLLGLDIFNRPMRSTGIYATIQNRANFVKSNFNSVATARVARIVPAFGIGGIGNNYLRENWRDMLIKREALKSIAIKHDDTRRRYHTRRLVGLLSTKHAEESSTAS